MVWREPLARHVYACQPRFFSHLVSRLARVDEVSVIVPVAGTGDIGKRTRHGYEDIALAPVHDPKTDDGPRNAGIVRIERYKGRVRLHGYLDGQFVMGKVDTAERVFRPHPAVLHVRQASRIPQIAPGSAIRRLHRRLQYTGMLLVRVLRMQGKHTVRETVPLPGFVVQLPIHKLPSAAQRNVPRPNSAQQKGRFALFFRIDRRVCQEGPKVCRLKVRHKSTPLGYFMPPI